MNNTKFISGILSEPEEPHRIVGCVEGYKVFDQNWTCHGHQFQMGEVNTYVGELKLGHLGFNFYRNAIDCAEQYLIFPTSDTPQYRYAKVRTPATSQVISNHIECISDQLEIIQEISHLDFLQLCTGQLIGYYSGSGQKRADCEYLNGRKHGLYRHWSKEGQLLVKINYVEGQMCGQSIEWNRKGTKIYQCGFLNGKEHGIYRDWYPNGQIRLRCHFLAGTLNGDWEFYYPSGQLEEDRYYTMGIY